MPLPPVRPRPAPSGLRVRPQRGEEVSALPPAVYAGRSTPQRERERERESQRERESPPAVHAGRSNSHWQAPLPPRQRGRCRSSAAPRTGKRASEEESEGERETEPLTGFAIHSRFAIHKLAGHSHLSHKIHIQVLHTRPHGRTRAHTVNQTKDWGTKTGGGGVGGTLEADGTRAFAARAAARRARERGSQTQALHRRTGRVKIGRENEHKREKTTSAERRKNRHKKTKEMRKDENKKKNRKQKTKRCRRSSGHPEMIGGEAVGTKGSLGRREGFLERSFWAIFQRYLGHISTRSSTESVDFV